MILSLSRKMMQILVELMHLLKTLKMKRTWKWKWKWKWKWRRRRRRRRWWTQQEEQMQTWLKKAQAKK